MAVMIESLIGILLFTILIVPLTLKNPFASVGDYPPILAVVLKQFNGADTFWKGFRDSYLIWLIIDI